jgi:hypothetical protein
MNIYVANLAKYNEGHLVGKWLALPMDADNMQKEIKLILGTDEEYAIHDYEAPFPISEYSNPFHLNQIAELDESALDRFTYLVNEGYDWDYAFDHYDDVIFYEGMDIKTVANDMLDDGCFGCIPDSIMNLIDVDRVVDLLVVDGYVETDKGTFHYQ